MGNEVVDNRTTKKDDNKNYTSCLRPKLDVYNKKVITESNSHHIKTKLKQLNLYITRKDMRLVLDGTV